MSDEGLDDLLVPTLREQLGQPVVGRRPGRRQNRRLVEHQSSDARSEQRRLQGADRPVGMADQVNRAGRVGGRIHHCRDVGVLLGDGVADGVAAGTPAAAVDGVHSGVRLQQRQHGVPPGVVGRGAVHQDQRPALPAAEVGDVRSVP
jgi:hypothetical protein